MAGRVHDKVAIVIGAARGIGAAVAERLVEEGARVTIADTLAEDGEATAKRLGNAARRRSSRSTSAASSRSRPSCKGRSPAAAG